VRGGCVMVPPVVVIADESTFNDQQLVSSQTLIHLGCSVFHIFEAPLGEARFKSSGRITLKAF
jgi:hypothetical protein